MFVETDMAGPSVRREIFTEREMEPGRPPCSYRRPCFHSDIALLAEGVPGRLGFYKHGPPDGGRTGPKGHGGLVDHAQTFITNRNLERSNATTLRHSSTPCVSTPDDRIRSEQLHKA